MYEAQEGKAIPYTMELTDLGGPMIGSGSGYYGATNPYIPGGAVSGRVQTPLSQREAFVHSQTYGGTEGVDWLMDAVGFIIQSASNSRFHFSNAAGKELVIKKSENDPPTVGEVDPNLKRLFEMPNPYMDWQEFLEVTLIDFLLIGNAYWVKFKSNDAKQPAALYRMCPQYVRIVPDKFGPSKYLYKLPGMQNEITFDPSEVMHFRRANPHNPYFGLGIVKGGSRAIDMELALTDTAANYYEHQALPTGVVETDRRVPRDVFNKLKQQLVSFYGGSRNAGRLMVLEAGLKFTSVSPTAGDALFAEMGAWSRDRVLALFNMNASLLGIFSGNGDPAIADWQRLFDQKTMIPLLNKFGRAISRGLTQPGWSLDFEFDYEETQAPTDVINRATLLGKLPGVKVHELRDAAGLTPSTGDPDVDNIVLNLPGPNMDANGQNGFPDRNLPGEAGRPPIPENTRAIGSSGPAGGKNGVVVKNQKAMEAVQDVLDRVAARRYALEGKALPPARTHVGDLKTTIPPEDSLHSARTTEVDAIVADMTRDIKSAVHDLERGLLDASEGKASGSTMYQRIKNSKAWAAFRARLSEILESGAQRGVSLANIQHTKVGHQPNLDVDYAKIAKEQVQRDEGVLSIVKNFKDDILQQILILQRHGSNPGEFTKAIMDGTAKWKDGHAETVALTEATIAYNEGTALVADANGLNLLVSDGEDFDEPCAQANGQVWTAEKARENSIEHPNCRRAFVPVDQPAT